MSKRTVIGAIFVLSIGLVLGAFIVSGFGGFTFSFAEGTARQFNSQPLYQPSPEVASLNDAFSQVSKIVTPQVVFINVKSKPDDSNTPQLFPFGNPHGDMLQEGAGSGIILTSDGYILTNYHVVDGATEDGISVTLNDSREFPAKIIGTDKSTDIAVIKIDADNLSPASLGNSDSVKVGEWVLAVGNPLGLTSTVTAGIVSAISRNVRMGADAYAIENFIQTDAVVNPGNSGGALVDLNGRVVGVNSAIVTGGGFSRNYIGYSFAVPINLAKTVAAGLIRYGKFVRGYIGVSISTLDAKKAKGLGLDKYQGVLVETVQKDGAGEAAGLEPGDVILQVNGKEVNSASELQAMVGMHQPGDKVTLKLFHRGDYVTKDVTLKGREGEDNVAEASKKEKEEEKMETASSSETATFDKAGFSVTNLDESAQKQFDRKSGVLVTDVKRYAPAYDNNLRPGVVIFEARHGSKVTNINNVDDLKNVLKKLGPNDAVLLRVQTEQGNTAFIPIEGPVS